MVVFFGVMVGGIGRHKKVCLLQLLRSGLRIARKFGYKE
jgi:hypothetical protein